MRRPYRLSLLPLLLLLLGLVWSSPLAARSWELVDEGRSLGQVPIMASDSAHLAAVDVMARLSGCNIQPGTDSLVVTLGRSNFRLVRDAAAIWQGHSIVSLPHRTLYQDGHWWIEAQAALRIVAQLFQAQGHPRNLSWGVSHSPGSSSAPAVASAPEPEPSAPAPSPQQPQAQSSEPLPQLLQLRWGVHDDKVRVVADLQESLAPKVDIVPGKLFLKVATLAADQLAQLAPPVSDVTLTVQNGPEAELAFFFPQREATAFELQNPHRYVIDIPRQGSASDSSALTAPDPTPALAVASAPEPEPEPSAPAPSSQQPQAQSSEPLPQLLQLRWGVYDDKVRVVADLQESLAPNVGIVPGKFFLKVATLAPDQLDQLTPPVSDVTLTVQNGPEAELAFFFPQREATAFELQNPHRYVIDIPRQGSASGSSDLTAPDPTPAPAVTPARQAVRAEPQRRAKPLVVIDAGHGGKDPGAVSGRYREKVLALQIANRLAEEVRQLGMDVRMTRTGDSYPSLRERTAMANEWKADAFISVHLNALPKGRHAKGMEIYIMALPTDKDAMELAKIENAEIADGTNGVTQDDQQTEMLLSILGNLQQNAKIIESTSFAEVLFDAGQKAGLNMRRVAQAPFWVLRGAAMPAVLIETGFITEASEAKMLADPAYQAKMAKALAQGVAKFLQ